MTRRYLDNNRRFWDGHADRYQRKHVDVLSTTQPKWGLWGIPEAELGILGDVAGLDVLELGCGAAQWGICLARAGARVTGIDLSEEQLRRRRPPTSRRSRTGRSGPRRRR